jgi:hypothetical protein
MISQSASAQGRHNTIIQAIGDNITVNKGGSPHLSLVPWQMEVATAERDLDLLDPACQAVPLIGRDADLRFLRGWVEDGNEIRVMALVGQGGSGKTRLALTLLQQLPEGWDAGFLTSREARRFLDSGNLAAWGWQKPALIVVDYAALLAATLSEWLAELAHHPPPTSPLRIMLIERHADSDGGWYHDLASGSRHGRRVRKLFSPSDPHRLSPLNEESDRRTVLAEGLKAAQRFTPDALPLKLPSPGEDLNFDREIAHPQWADPLLLLMAAVIGAASGLPHALSLSRVDLALNLADREAARLRASTESSAEGDLLVHLYACVILCGGMSREAVGELAQQEFAALRELYPGGPGRAVRDLCRLIGAQDFLPSLVPDLLAEAFLLVAFALLPRQGREVIARVVPFAKDKMAGVLIRTARDYAHARDPRPLLWLNAFIEQGESDPISAKIRIDSYRASG